MTSINDLNRQTQVFQLKGSLFPFTILRLNDLDPLGFAEQLKHMVVQAPKFFHQTPVVLDLSTFKESNETIDFILYRDLLLKQGLVPVGITGGNETHQAQAAQLHLAIFSAKKLNDDISKINQASAQPTASLTPPNNRIITGPVRSGQQVYAKQGDLIVLSSVSHGAELLAVGNIHVYGELRGRALAGINGNKTARIFCQKLNAELIAIAGQFCLNEQIQNYLTKSNLQIYLENERITIDEL